MYPVSLTSPAAVPVAPTIPTRVQARDLLVAVADAVHAPTDAAAARYGLTIARYGLTGRVYRSPLFDTLGGAR